MDKARSENAEAGVRGNRSKAAEIALEAAVGAVAGATAGLLAGPPGAAVGAVLGGAVGALSGIAIDRTEREKAARREQMDRDTGVIGGDIGAPSLRHPPPAHGLYHAATLGVSTAETEDTEGPIQNVDAN